MKRSQCNNLKTPLENRRCLLSSSGFRLTCWLSYVACCLFLEVLICLRRFSLISTQNLKMTCPSRLRWSMLTSWGKKRNGILPTWRLEKANIMQKFKTNTPSIVPKVRPQLGITTQENIKFQFVVCFCRKTKTKTKTYTNKMSWFLLKRIKVSWFFWNPKENMVRLSKKIRQTLLKCLVFLHVLFDEVR